MIKTLFRSISVVKIILMSVVLLTSFNSRAFTLLDRSIAIVDEDVVLASELESKVRVIENRMVDEVNNNSVVSLQERVLNHLILEKLQLQMAKRAGMTISEAEITKAIDRLQQDLEEKQQSMEAYLQENEFADLAELREEIHRELLIAQVQQYQVNRRIRISEQDVENFLDSKDGQEWRSPQYRLRHILIAVDSNNQDSMQIVEARAEAIYQRLLAGAHFGQMAVDMSNGNNAANGGDLGWRKNSNLPNLFVQHVQGQEIGTIIKPFRSGAGVHILQLADRQGIDRAMVQQSKVRHILIKTSAIINDDDARKKLDELRVRILSGENFDSLAKQYSEDITTALSGGDLGWSTPGKFVPAFEEVMHQTLKANVSHPFRSQFGWHILHIEDRREQDMTDTLTRNQASRLLRQLRFEDELRIWLQEIRDNAYVEILI